MITGDGGFCDVSSSSTSPSLLFPPLAPTFINITLLLYQGWLHLRYVWNSPQSTYSVHDTPFSNLQKPAFACLNGAVREIFKYFFFQSPEWFFITQISLYFFKNKNKKLFFTVPFPLCRVWTEWLSGRGDFKVFSTGQLHPSPSIVFNSVGGGRERGELFILQ